MLTSENDSKTHTHRFLNTQEITSKDKRQSLCEKRRHEKKESMDFLLQQAKEGFLHP